MAVDDKKRIKELEEMIQVILLAIPTEITAYEFYMSAVNKSVNESSRSLFETLAKQEKGHEASLRKILEELKGELNQLRNN